MGTIFTMSPCTHIIVCTPLTYKDLVEGAKVSDATGGEAEPSGKGCETADAPGSFTSDAWNLSSIVLHIL